MVMCFGAANPPAPSPRWIATLYVVGGTGGNGGGVRGAVATARSGLLSPLKSAIAVTNGLGPVGRFTGAENPPAPSPKSRITRPDVSFVTSIRSFLPSLFRSPARNLRSPPLYAIVAALYPPPGLLSETMTPGSG